MNAKRLKLLPLLLAFLLGACGGGGGGDGGPAPATLVSIVVTPADPSVRAGQTQQLTATGTYSDNSTQDLTTSIAWSSSNETVAAVTSSGLASAKIIGTTAITAASGGVSGQTVLTVTSAVSLPKSGQTLCYDASGNQISCANTGQDGELQKGVVWPDPRFTDNGDGTVTDHLTGLMWLKDANCIRTYDAAHPASEFDQDGSVGDGEVSWLHALDFVKGINAGTYASCAGGYNDWRLPNVNELLSLHDFSKSQPALQTRHPFSNIGFGEYWSSTSAEGNAAWAVSMHLGLPGSLAKGFWRKYVWPVRGSANGPIQLAKTGQMSCYDVTGAAVACAGTGQDGEFQAGVAWPIARFTDNGDGTITDNLTGLMWLRDANCALTVGYDPDATGNGSATWQNALNFVKDVNAGTYSVCSAGHADWRLPNAVEMISLATPNQNHTFTWLASAGFLNLQDGLHWSSTTGVDLPGSALVMYSGHGVWPRDPKTNTYYFWLVRQ